jgi:preprotein translocase subunit SecE
VNNSIVISIWVAIVGVAFAVAWRKGYLLQLSTYVDETKQELKKCTWPTWDELKASTVLVAIAIGALGVFTFAADQIFYHVVTWILKA